MADWFDGAWRKFTHGSQHLKALNDHLAATTADPHNVVAVKGDYEPATMSFLYTVRSIPDLAHAQMMVGDTIHNFRGALDHMTWALVRHYGAVLTESQARRVQFPMATSAASFRSQVGGRLPDVPGPIRTLIQRHQPYRRDATGYGLKLLRDLSDRDKHRLPVISTVAFREAAMEFESIGCRIVGLDVLLSLRPLRVGTKVARLFVVPEPPDSVNGNVQMKTLLVAFPSLGYRRQVKETMGLIEQAAGSVLAAVAGATGQPGHEWLL